MSSFQTRSFDGCVVIEFCINQITLKINQSLNFSRSVMFDNTTKFQHEILAHKLLKRKSISITFGKSKNVIIMHYRLVLQNICENSEGGNLRNDAC